MNLLYQQISTAFVGLVCRMECDIIQTRPEARGRCLLVGTNIRAVPGRETKERRRKFTGVSIETGPLSGHEPKWPLNDKEVLDVYIFMSTTVQDKRVCNHSQCFQLRVNGF